MNTSDYVELDNLSKTENILLNILWENNRGMTLKELTDSVNEHSGRCWNKNEIRQFIRSLIQKAYVESKRHKLVIYYYALGSDYEL